MEHNRTTCTWDGQNRLAWGHTGTWGFSASKPHTLPAYRPQTHFLLQRALTLPGASLLRVTLRGKEGSEPAWAFKRPFPMVLWAHLPISHEPQPTRKWNCWVILPPHPHPRRVCAASREGSLIPLTLSPRWLCLWYSLLEGWEDSPHHSCNPQVSEIVRVSVSLMVIAPSWILGDLLGQGPCPSVVKMDSSFVYLLVKFFFF